jgi:hypothetical protein
MVFDIFVLVLLALSVVELVLLPLEARLRHVVSSVGHDDVSLHSIADRA